MINRYMNPIFQQYGGVERKKIVPSERMLAITVSERGIWSDTSTAHNSLKLKIIFGFK